MSSTNDQHDTVPGEESPCGVKFQSLEPLYKLIYLAKNGDADEIKILLEKQEFTDVVNDADNNEKYTPLMWAAVEGQTKVVEILCQNPVVNINGRGGWNDNTALIRAVQRGHIDIVELLIRNKADLNLKNKFGMTALMLVSELKESTYDQRPYPEIIDLLIANNADINLGNNDKFSALIFAAIEGNINVIERLLKEEKIDVDAKNKFGKTAFFNACEFGHFDCVKALYFSGKADKNSPSGRGVTPIMLAAVKQREAIVKFLIEKGADLTVGPKGGDNVLSNACTGGNEAIVEMILKEDPDVSSHAYVALLSLCKNAKSSKSILVLLIQNLEKPGMTTNLVSDLIQTPDSDGNTCFMHACNVGHMEILCVLLEVIYLEHIPHQTEEKDVKTQKDNKDAVRKAETKKPDEYTCQPIEDVHVLFKSKNHAGQNAVELLANHFKDQWDNRETGTERDETPIKKFLSLAIVCNYKWPFLLEMMKFILPKLKSPLSLIHKYGDLIINDLHYGGIKANTDLYKDPILAHQIHNLFDLNLIGALVSMAAALKLAAIACPVESSELEEKVIEYENMVQRCIECDELEKPANVTRALTRQYELDPKVSQSVHKARAFLHGPLKLCIEHDLTKLLATPVIRKHVEDVFSESLHERVNESISSISDLVQLRSGCSSYRYCPVVMFSFESLMKIVFLGIAIVAIAVRANSNVCPASNSKDLTSWISKQVYCTDLNFLNGCLILFWATSALYEIGEILNRTNLGLGSVSQNIMQFGTETMEHLKDRWNMIDLITVVLLSIWSVSKSTSSMQMYLCLSAISLSVGILRFLSKWQKTGQVVIMYFAMLEDLLPFFFVFLIFVLGFGIALHGMFPNLDEFSSVARTFLALFDAALGQHTFGIFENKEYQFIGEILMASYIVLVMIVLINLIIARMSSTHDEISDKALEMWSKVQAKNAEEFVMNRDRHVMCMLPAPFNLIPMLVSIGELVLRTDKTVVPEGSIGIISYTGTACDWVTSIFFSFWGAFREIVLVVSDVHQSNLPTESKLFLGVIFIGLAPVWFVFFWVEIMISIVYECGTYTNPLSKEIKMKPGNNNETFTLSRQNTIRLFVASGTVFKLMAPYFGIPRVIATLWFSMLASVTACFAIDKPMKKSMVHVLFNRPAVKAYICAFITTRLEFICRLHSFVSPYNLPAGESERNCIVERYFDTFTMVVFVLFYIIVCFCHIELLLALVMPFLIEYFTGPTPKKISEILSFATLLSKFPLSSDKKLRVCKRQSLTRQISESTKVISDRSASGTIGIYTATNAIRAANKFHHSLNNKRHEKEAKRVNEPHQAVLNLSVIRGVLNKSGINAFGGKANPYVIVYYPYTPGTKDVVNPEYLYKSKPVYKGGNAPNFNWNDNKINIIEGKHDLLIEVVDKSDISNPDRLLLYKEVDIKEWIADKRFEGELKMNDAYSSEATFIHPDGKVTQDYVQIAAKITYSTRPDLVSQNSIRQSDIFVPSPSTLTAAHTPVPPRSDATPRSTAPSRFKVENEPLSLAHPDERSSSTLSRRGSDASIDIGQEKEIFFFSKEDRANIFKKDKNRDKDETRHGERKSKSGSTSPKSQVPSNVKFPRQVLDDEHSEG